jgi:hypothetical protein
MCKTCKHTYVGQTSRDLKQRYQEHMHYIENNTPQSAFALRILNNCHEYGTIDKIMALLKTVRRTITHPIRTIFHPSTPPAKQTHCRTESRQTQPYNTIGYRHNVYITWLQFNTAPPTHTVSPLTNQPRLRTHPPTLPYSMQTSQF